MKFIETEELRLEIIKKRTRDSKFKLSSTSTTSYSAKPLPKRLVNWESGIKENELTHQKVRRFAIEAEIQLRFLRGGPGH